ncbi:MAG: hypothetical protein PVG39_01390 [Desulfobacteraceae bacterium]|jgi:hypothetical protein
MCKCQRCGKYYKVDISVPDDIWSKITPLKNTAGGGLLCGSCIMEEIEALGKYDIYELTKNIDYHTGYKIGYDKGRHDGYEQKKEDLKWITPARYKEITGKDWPEDGPVWERDCDDFTDDPWRMCAYWLAKMQYSDHIVIANEYGIPPVDFIPEETK